MPRRSGKTARTYARRYKLCQLNERRSRANFSAESPEAGDREGGGRGGRGRGQGRIHKPGTDHFTKTAVWG
eukprot:584581-Pyramimonas_sp.AAC.1